MTATSRVTRSWRTMLSATAVLSLLALAGCDAADPGASPSATATLPTASAAAKSDVCHYDADAGTYALLNVADAAVDAHIAHGDARPGDPVPTREGYVFDEACQAVLVSLLQQLSPITAIYETGAFTGSGFGDVTGNVVPVDINLTGDRANTSGCEAADFAGFPAGSIALIQRGTCFFGNKAANAEAAGASAVVFFNQGNTTDREGLLVANASVLMDGTGVTHGIPVVGASFADGVALAQPGSTARVVVAAPTP